MTTKEPTRILFVDDEENILRSLKRLFMDEPYDILTAPSGADGLEVLKKEGKVSVIVSDQRMPNMTGAEFLEKSREITPNAVRLVLTGYSDITAAVDAINKGGAWKYLSKPWKDDELVQVVREAAERYSLMDENRRLDAIVQKQNEELKKWNAELELHVQRQTLDIQKQNAELQKMNTQLVKSFTDTINAFSGLIELRNPLMRNHSRTVAKFSVAMAGSLKIPFDESEVIESAAMLHDIGKIGMSDMVLLKQEEDMSPDELSEYRLHAVRGQSAVAAVEDLREAGLLIRHHHERYDGKGYPDCLKGETIPLGARIIAIADFSDTVASLAKGMVVHAVIQRLRAESGKYLDPRMVPLAEQHVRTFYANLEHTTKIVEVEIQAKDLKDGYVISRDVLSGTGILLLGRGVQLSAKSIAALQRHLQNDPPKGGIFVQMQK